MVFNISLFNKYLAPYYHWSAQDPRTEVYFSTYQGIQYQGVRFLVSLDLNLNKRIVQDLVLY